MAWPKGKPRKAEQPPVVDTTPLKRTVRDLVEMLNAYRASAGNLNRGLFADCELDIYRMFHAHHNDAKAIDNMRPTGASDRVYHEWEVRFRRAFGELSEAA